MENGIAPSYAPQAGLSNARLNLFFCLVGALLYFVILTNGTFSLSGRETLDEAYGALARSIMLGHLDVTRAVIGNEGFYVDGKVYLYYGILPALLRLPFLLAGGEWLPGPRLLVFLEAILAALLFHLTVFRVLTSGTSEDRQAQPAIPIFAGAIGWFASPAFLLTSNASIYNEPYGCALVLLAATIYLLREPIITALSGEFPHISAGRLAFVALLSALCLHARPPMAVSLFALVGALCLWSAFEPHAGRSPCHRIGHMVRKSLLPGLILLTSAGSFLWLNWVRFGAPFSSGPITHYGYYLFIEGRSDRMAAFIEHGRFDPRRILPNLAVNLTGLPWLHGRLSQLAGVGMVRLEGPLTGVLILWLLPCIYALFGLRTVSRVIRSSRCTGLWLASLTVCMSLSTLIILSYATVTLRYKSEIWPLIFVLAIVGLHGQRASTGSRYALSTGNTGSSSGPLASAPVWAMLAVSLLASATAVFALKSDPFYNGNPAGIFLDLLHPDLSGS